LKNKKTKTKNIFHIDIAMKAKQVPKGYWPRLFVQDGWVLAMLVWSRWLDIGHACLVKMAGYWPRLFGQDGWILATLVWSRWLGIGHACLVKMAGYRPGSFLRVYGPLLHISPQTWHSNFFLGNSVQGGKV